MNKIEKSKLAALLKGQVTFKIMSGDAVVMETKNLIECANFLDQLQKSNPDQQYRVVTEMC